MTAPTVPSSRLARPIGQPPLAETSSIVAFGILSWLGCLWIVVGVLFGIALGVISIVGELESSLWHGAVAGWQRYVVAAAGATSVGFFLRTLVGNGVTRARWAASTAVAGAVLAVLGASFILVGYLGEELVFGANDWRHVIDGDDPVALGGFADYAEVFVDHLLTLAAFFTSGWLLGVCWSRWNAAAVPAFVLCLVPVATAEVLLRGQSGVDVVDGWSFDPPLLLGAAVSIAVTAAGCWAAARLSREIEVS